MKTQAKRWEVLYQGRANRASLSKIVDILLKNRGIKTKEEKKEFFKPTPPEKVSSASLKIKSSEVTKAIGRIKRAKSSGEKVLVFGDYDADGVCATAILWECLYALGLDTIPYIPERFSEGYGLKKDSVKRLKEENPKLGLIITVDNGMVAHEAVDEANKLGVDVIITDHHLKGKKLPKAHSIIHTTKIGGAAIAWILAREILKKFKIPLKASRKTSSRDGSPGSRQSSKFKIREALELVAIGTIADQLPLIGPNRSFVKYGLASLNKTERPGLLALFREAVIERGKLGSYEIGFVIAPRINAMGRLKHAIDSLRLLCTRSNRKAQELAQQLGRTNIKRRKIVAEVVAHAKGVAEKRQWRGVMVLAHETYHEGVIGLAASGLVEEFYRPAIVFSKGEIFSKASGRSIPGFNIIEAIRKVDDMLLDGGGHPMAAGFTIETGRIEEFRKRFEKTTSDLLTDELLTKRLGIDLELDFSQLNWELLGLIKKFAPIGLGNPTPTFVSKKVEILDARVVGREGRHLKLTLEQKGKFFDAIAFGFGGHPRLSPEIPIDVVYRLEENIWSGKRSLQLKIKDLKVRN